MKNAIFLGDGCDIEMICVINVYIKFERSIVLPNTFLICEKRWFSSCTDIILRKKCAVSWNIILWALSCLGSFVFSIGNWSFLLVVLDYLDSRVFFWSWITTFNQSLFWDRCTSLTVTRFWRCIRNNWDNHMYKEVWFSTDML